MERHQHTRPKPNPWKFRIRIVTLITFLTLGLGIAAIERWRPEEFSPVWGSFHEKIFSFLKPVSERAYRIVSVAIKVDRLMKAEDEKKQLLRDSSKLHIENQILAEQLSRLNRLAGLGKWSGPTDLTFLSADVIGLITGGQSAVLIINRGRIDGVQPHDAVVALGGLVGIVQSVSENTANVQSVTDSVSNVGVMDRTSRARGIVIGRGRNAMMEFMPENEVQPINIGGELITSGFPNSVFPKGVIVGRIQDRKLNTYGIPYGEVKPAVSFESLEEVLLVLPRSRLQGKNEPTTATLGTKRIFMPGASLADDLPDTVTTTSLIALPSGSYDIGSTLTLPGNALTSPTQGQEITTATQSATQSVSNPEVKNTEDEIEDDAPAVASTPTPAPSGRNPSGKKMKKEKGSP